MDILGFTHIISGIVLYKCFFMEMSKKAWFWFFFALFIFNLQFREKIKLKIEIIYDFKKIIYNLKKDIWDR